ncbi:MAG: folate-binding protein YgfZ [Acidithiobacillus sp.]|nr:folate-binding protein YgfZ [Acidithiobacillus sp.]
MSSPLCFAPLTNIMASIHVHGPDAEKFLQGQFSNDLCKLPMGQAQWSSYSTAKGRMIANFLIWRDKEAFRLILAADMVEETVARLNKYRLMAKVEIQAQEPGAGLWALWGDEAELQPLHSRETPLGLQLRLPWPENVSLLFATEDPRPALQARNGLQWEPEHWWLSAIGAGTAFITKASSEQIIPQELNLEVLGGISFQKGCYPGQEIVARSHYLGQLKRQCYRIYCEQSLSPGDQLFCSSMGEQAVGLIVNVAPENQAFTALAVIRASNAKEELHVHSDNGPLVRLGELPYPLPLEHPKGG